MLDRQEMTGGVVSTTVTVWLHGEAFVQLSVARQVRVAVKVSPHCALVTVLTTVMVRLVPSQMSVPLGESKDHRVPHSMVLPATQVITGGVVSTTVTVWLHGEAFVQVSVTRQVRVAV